MLIRPRVVLPVIAITWALGQSLPAGEIEISPGFHEDDLKALVASQRPYPHDLSTEVYRDLLWLELPYEPPELAVRGDSAIDAVHAYRLYMYYRYCSRAMTPEQADQNLEVWAERAGEADGKKLQGILSRAERAATYAEMCLPVSSADQLLEAFLWAGEAARLGSEVAQIQYFSAAGSLLTSPFVDPTDGKLIERHPELESEFNKTAQRSLERALERGHPDAFLAMSKAIAENHPVDAYAFAHAAELISYDDRVFRNKIGIQKAKLTPRLKAKQIVEAEAQGRELVAGWESNAN